MSDINEYLKKKRLKEVEIDAVAAVFYLAMNEVCSISLYATLG
jgi:hypothetical protein